MPKSERINAALFNRRTLMCVFTGFSSGLPLYLLFSLVPTWLKSEAIDIKKIGLFALIQNPYVWKFLWSPLVDRYALGPSAWGRRRGWMLATQVLIMVGIASLGQLHPNSELPAIAALAAMIAFFSATQDIALDAYRRELLVESELGFGNAIHVNAYRIAGLVPGSLALVLADHYAWSTVYYIVAAFMLPGLIATLFAPSENTTGNAPSTLLAAVIEPFFEFVQRLGIWAALEILAFLFLYKLGDSMATTLATPFYIDLGFSKSEIGLIAKNAGLWPSVIGGILGMALLARIGINRALWLFGAIQLLSILGFAWLAQAGHNPVGLAAVISLEAIGVGLGTAAFVAYIAHTSDPRYTATQFALFTSLSAVPRTIIGAGAGWLVAKLGWHHYFWLCFALGIPGMLLLLRVAPWNDPKRAEA